MGRSQHRKYAQKFSIIQTTSHQERLFTSTLNSHKSGRKDKNTGDPFCVFCESKGHWAQDYKVTEVRERKAAHRCFLCLNRCHNGRACSRKGRASCTRCKGAHHRSIYNETETATTPTRETTSTTVVKIVIASPIFI